MKQIQYMLHIMKIVNPYPSCIMMSFWNLEHMKIFCLHLPIAEDKDLKTMIVNFLNLTVLGHG